MVFMIEKMVAWFIYGGMPAVALYHTITESAFLNVEANDATGLEWVANQILTPVQFVVGGKVAVFEEGNYRLEPRFNYETNIPLKSVGSLVSFPVALPVGSLLKTIAFLSQETRLRHKRIERAMNARVVHSNIPLYKAMGLPIGYEEESLSSPEYQRRPGEEMKLGAEKELLKEIARLFNEHEIPFWVDCGTCLGAYRYGGVIPWDGDIDVAILEPDFQNAWNVLHALDPEKYQAQDWSNRCKPKTYIRIYLKETRNHIDIYTYAIDPREQTLTYIISNEESSFMKESWKIHERRFKYPTKFETIFPLKKALFDGIEVNVPRNTKKYLQERYGENIGPIKIYNEVTGEYEKDLTHPYWQLPYVY
jgi:phosphorylcholine metabolism protein LicD